MPGLASDSDLPRACLHLRHLRLEDRKFAIELFDLDFDVAYPRIGLRTD